MSDQNKLDTFRKMCEDHDLTFTYSDDSGVWNRGRQEYTKILAFSKTIADEDAVRIWNEVATKKLIDPTEYLWSN